MSLRFVHTLLFLCPRCKCPIAITRIRDEGNVEAVDSEQIQIACGYCESSSVVLGANAKRHYISEWPFQEWPQSLLTPG